MHRFRLFLLALVCIAGSSAGAAVADDHAELERLLHEFLAGANERAVHETFWAEDLIYTSSSGARFGKDSILAGFDDAEADGPYPPTYRAEDVTVRVSGDTAVVTFRMLAEQDGERVAEYFNTGVFRRSEASWEASTWQATQIPNDE